MANGITYWARAVGTARSRDLDGARANIAKLESIRDRLIQSKKQDGADTLEIMRLQAAGWTAFAAGQKDEAIRLLRALAGNRAEAKQLYTKLRQVRHPLVQKRGIFCFHELVTTVQCRRAKPHK